jgi:hypothetical protein
MSGITRCTVRAVNTQKFIAQLNNKNIVDNGNRINIGVYFNICYITNQSDIIKNVKYAIETLNKDFDGTPSNLNYGASYINSLPNKVPYTYVKQMYTNSLQLKAESNIKFVCMGVKYIPITEKDFIKQYGEEQVGIERFILSKAQPVDQSKLLNIWIVPMTSLLGFSYFPWMSAANTSVNGVVLNYHTFDRNNLYTTYNLNKTMTHEVGHWLGLLHTFQDYNMKPAFDTFYGIQNAAIDYVEGSNIQEITGDCVVDTPPQKIPTFGNPLKSSYNINKIITSLNNTQYCAMFTNFMDYTDDANMFIFTKDQITKIRLFIIGYRQRIITEPINVLFDFTKNIIVQKISNSQSRLVETTMEDLFIVPDIANTILKSTAPIELASYDQSKSMFKTSLNSYLEITQAEINTDNIIYVTFHLICGNMNTYVGYFHRSENIWYITKVNKLSKTVIEVNISISHDINLNEGLKFIVGTFGNKQDATYIEKISVSEKIKENILKLEKQSNLHKIE